MNEIAYSHVSSTFSHVLRVGLVAAWLINSGSVQALDERTFSIRGPYFKNGNSDTFSSYGNPLTGAFDFVSSDFEHAVSCFYARLLDGQEPLGADFEQVLFDNLWDLYES